MNLDILPLAITMMAGPQIMSAIIFLTVPKPERLSASFIVGVAIATVAGVVVALAIANLLGNGISLGAPSNAASIGKLIQYLFVGLLVALAVKNYLRRETVEPPRWLGTLLSPDWKTRAHDGAARDLADARRHHRHVDGCHEPRTQRRWASGGTAVHRGDRSLVAALPLLLYLLFHRRAQWLMPKVRDWMNTYSSLLNIVTCGVFIAFIL